LRNAASVREIRLLLRSEDRKTRQLSAWFLGQVADRRSTPALLRALRTEADAHLRGVYVDALGSIGGKRATDALVRLLLDSRDTCVRERSASSLRFVKTTPEVFDALVRVLDNVDEESVVREMAAEALLFHNPEQAVPALRRALQDASPNVRYWAIHTLSFMSASDVIPELEQIATNDTAVIFEPDTLLVWGTISTAAAETAIKIKERCGIELTNEQECYRRGEKL
jgi:HEAT repeat protein